MGELQDLVRRYFDDPEEGPLFARVVANPGDRELREVYKQLLERRNDPRAGLVFGKLPFHDQKALMRAAEIVDKPEVSAWFAFMEARDLMAPIRNCGLGADPGWGGTRFSFECPRTWDSLARTTDPKVRSCDTCKREVYFCDDDAELVANAAKDRCVAMKAPDETWLANRARREQVGSWTGRPQPVDYLAAYLRARRDRQS